MNYHVLTLFPDMINNAINESITGRAIAKQLINVETVNIRDFSGNKHGQIDDYPYGGGAGMLIQAPPVYRSYKSIADRLNKKPRVIYTTPQGKTFNQKIARELAKEDDLIFLCGHYEGIDERVLELIVTDNVSIGDYVLTGGELPTLVMMDAVSRLVPGVLGSEVSSQFESFYDNLLEYPQYTRPPEFEGMKVPDILLSGNHKLVDEWRRSESIKRTFFRRPDLLKEANLTDKEKKFVEELEKN